MDEEQPDSIAKTFQRARDNAAHEISRKSALQNVVFTPAPMNSNHSDVIFRDYDRHMAELQVKTDSDLSQGTPDPDFSEYIAARNLCDISASRKMANSLKWPEGKCAHTAHVPERSGPPESKSLVGGIAGGSHSSQSGGPTVRPVSVFIECCCGPESLLGRRAAEHGVTPVRFTKDSHDLTTVTGFNKARREILGHIKNNQDIHLWASLPCKPWS